MNENERNACNFDESIIPITTFKNTNKEMLIRKVNFLSTCEHHLASITNGQCWVGIIPNKKLLGMDLLLILRFFQTTNLGI